MELQAVRIIISAYTASFRVPHFVSHQLTLTVPPLSTIYGIISSASGRIVMPNEVEWLAYRFTYQSKAIDLEAIWSVKRAKPENPAKVDTRNVLEREFLVSPILTLYLPPKWAEVFMKPRYQLLLGRTQDVATVETISETTLQYVSSGEISGVLLPMNLVFANNVSAWLHNLPVAFTDEPQRKPIRLQLFGVIDAHRPSELKNCNEWLVKDMETKLILPIYRKEWVLYSE